jgi:soluble lytic murein transglycosylase-like protein
VNAIRSQRALRRSLQAAVCALALTAGSPEPASAGGAIYTYVDGNGVTHFTNRPKDKRYVRLEQRSSRIQHFVQAPGRWEYDGLIGLTARTHQVPPALVKAVIAAESDFDPNAVSRAGAQGLMQLMPKTAASLGVEDPLAPDENVDGGVRYLRSMMDRFGDLPLALAAYNAGPTAVVRYGGVPPYRETRDYVTRVLNYYRAYHGDFRR